MQTNEPLLFKETNIVSPLNSRSAKHHFPYILEDPILFILSADIICLTEANFYSGDNIKIDKYNCTQLPMDANSNTHGIMISASVFVNDLHLLHPLSASEHTIILGDFNVNCNTTPSLYEKVVQHFKTNDLQQCDQPHHNLRINIEPCFHWRTFAINNLQWLLLLRPHDTFN